MKTTSRSLTLVLFVLFGLFVAESSWAGSVHSSQALLVRYKAEGDAAVVDCAERVWPRGLRYKGATADRSDSLDRWHARHRVRQVRALFRRATGQALELETRALAERLGRGLRKRGVRESASALEQARRLASIYRVELADSADLAAAIHELQRDPHVDFVQFDYRNELDFDPNDPFLTSAGSWSQPYADLY